MLDCLNCKNNRINKCPIYKSGGYIEQNCPEFEESNGTLFEDIVCVHIEPIKLHTGCLICGEPVEIGKYEIVKICDKCKKAIMKVRSEMENDK